MPIPYLRSLVADTRTPAANRHLAAWLCFVAGAANAGGFMAIGQYTSHMSGIVSAMADELALGHLGLVLHGAAALGSFLLGAMVCAWLVNWGRRAELHSRHALPLLLEAALLVGFGLLGDALQAQRWLMAPLTVMTLCFVMGLQNAMVTKISHAEIRTTHVTGMVTDIGIELGRLSYWNRGDDTQAPVRADRARLRVLATLVGLFFVGGFAGALGFKQFGFVAAIPLALPLAVLALVPCLDDLRALARRRAR